MTWPSLSYVAEDHNGRIVGYILAKMYALRFTCYAPIDRCAGKKTSTKASNRMVMLPPFLFFAPIGGWA